MGKIRDNALEKSKNLSKHFGFELEFNFSREVNLNNPNEIANLIKELSAKKYSCKFERTFSDHVICSKLT